MQFFFAADKGDIHRVALAAMDVHRELRHRGATRVGDHLRRRWRCRGLWRNLTTRLSGDRQQQRRRNHAYTREGECRASCAPLLGNIPITAALALTMLHLKRKSIATRTDAMPRCRLTRARILASGRDRLKSGACDADRHE